MVFGLSGIYTERGLTQRLTMLLSNTFLHTLGQKQTLEGIYKIRSSHGPRYNISDMLCTLNRIWSSILSHQATRSGSPMLFNRALYWTASEAYILSNTYFATLAISGISTGLKLLSGTASR